MNKRIILSLTATALLASSLMAYNGQGYKHQDKQSCNKSKMHKAKHDRGGMFRDMIMKLDLSDKQKAEIKEIVKKSMANMPNPHDAFSDNSFDKKEFIKLVNKKRDAKVERRADMIEKIYAVLDASQKKDLKTMLDMRDIMKKNMMQKGKNCNAKNCDGRR